MQRLLLLVVAAAFALGACGNVNVAQPHSLALAFKTADTYKYKFDSTTNQTIAMGAMTIPAKVDVSGNESVTVKSVDSSGTATLAVTITNLNMKSTTANGVTNTTTVPSQMSTIQVAKDGRPVGASGSPLGDTNAFMAFSAMGGSFFISAVLPDHPVKPGDTWTKTYDQSNPGPTSGTIHVTSSSKYLRDESLKGTSAAVVETKSTGTFDLALDASKLGAGTGSTAPILGGAMTGMTIKGTVTSDVTTWIDPSGHRVMQTHSKTTDDGTMDIQMSSNNQAPMPGLTGPITVKGDATTDLLPA